MQNLWKCQLSPKRKTYPNAKNNPKRRPQNTRVYSAPIFLCIECYPGEYVITMNPTILPVMHPPWQVFIALRDKFKIVDQGILIPINQNNLMGQFICVCHKDQWVKLCLDPKDYTATLLCNLHIQGCCLKRQHRAKWLIVDVKTGYCKWRWT